MQLLQPRTVVVFEQRRSGYTERSGVWLPRTNANVHNSTAAIDNRTAADVHYSTAAIDNRTAADVHYSITESVTNSHPQWHMRFFNTSS